MNENNIFTLNCGATSDDIAELRAQGIEVDNKDPAPENTVAGVSAATGTQEELRTCPRRGDPNVTNTKGRFVAKPWMTVGEIDELALFCMCFPESFLFKVTLPAATDHIKGDTVNLSEFYVWLGCRFYMACFYGQSDFQKWRSTRPIDMFDGAPF